MKQKILKDKRGYYIAFDKDFAKKYGLKEGMPVGIIPISKHKMVIKLLREPMDGLTIKQIAKKQKMSRSKARYYVRKLDEAGIIKPCGMRGREVLWGLSDMTFNKLKNKGVFDEG